MRHQRTGGDHGVAFGREIIQEFLADFTAFHCTPWISNTRLNKARIIPRAAPAAIPQRGRKIVVVGRMSVALSAAWMSRTSLLIWAHHTAEVAMLFRQWAAPYVRAKYFSNSITEERK